VKLPPFQQLLDAHGRDVHRFLIASVGRDRADDCYQETWLAALRAYPRLRDASNLRSWIFTVAHRKAIDHVRAGRRQPVAVAELPKPAGSAGSFGSSGSGGAFGSGGSARSERDEELWGLVRGLPAKQRTAIALRFVADAPYAEIAAVMGTSEEAARRSVHEGLKRLRTEYGND
jgi:RNA polymerase sigma factor (sigma-70 family)